MSKQKLIRDLINRSSKITLPKGNEFVYVNEFVTTRDMYLLDYPTFKVETRNSLTVECNLEKTLSAYRGSAITKDRQYKSFKSVDMPDGELFTVAIGSKITENQVFFVAITDSTQDQIFWGGDNDDLLGFVAGKFKLLAYAEGKNADKLKTMTRAFKGSDPEVYTILSKLINDGGHPVESFNEIIKQLRGQK